MYAIVLILIWLFLSWWTLSGVGDNYVHYKLYKQIYNRLHAQQFIMHSYKNISQIWIANRNYNFTYFVNTGSVCLVEGIYLHSGILFSLDPVYAYWRYKYRKFFKEWMEYNSVLQSLQ